MTFTYTNTQTNETTTREAKHIGDAWSKSLEVSNAMNWNHEMFSEDVLVRSKKK